MTISVSILNADFSNLSRSIKKLEKCNMDSFHMDVMDGVFVDNLTFGPDIVSAVSASTSKPIISHLMIKRPEVFVERFFKAGSSSVTVHAETIDENNNSIIDRDHIGISMNPDIPVLNIESFLDRVDRVLVMSVFAGFGGQEFIHENIEKIKYLSRIKKEKKLDFIISVDGGINAKTAPLCIDAGAEELVIGSYLTKAKNPVAVMKELRKNIQI